MDIPDLRLWWFILLAAGALTVWIIGIYFGIKSLVERIKHKRRQPHRRGYERRRGF